jgi:hypothetical protein
MASTTCRPSVKVSLIAVFTAISLGTNFAMIDIPNVKLMDSFIFIAAFVFGLEVGLGSAVSVWAVYGFASPYGVDDFVTLSFLITGECLYALSGWALNRAKVGEDLFKSGSYHLTRVGAVFGLVGFQATFAYDVLTNFGSYFLRTSSAYQALLVGMITGAPFAILHEGSNLVFFATVVPLAIASFRRSGLTIENMSSVVSVIKCKNCGAPLNLKPGEFVATCRYCGYTAVVGADAPFQN